MSEKERTDETDVEALACPQCGATNADEAGDLCIGQQCPVQGSENFAEALQIYQRRYHLPLAQ